MICEDCGCSELDPCDDGAGGTCYWVDEGLCSACAARAGRGFEEFAHDDEPREPGFQRDEATGLWLPEGCR